MSIKNLIIIAAIFPALGLVSCKTTEANYRAAYEKAISARDSSESIEETIYGKVRNQIDIHIIPTSVGDVEVKTQLVKVSKDGGGTPERLARYNVIAGQFKQKFNAVSLRNRLADNGYPGAFVIETSEPYYYIVTESYSSVDEAARAMKALQEAKPQGVKEPCPYLLDATARRTSAKAK